LSTADASGRALWFRRSTCYLDLRDEAMSDAVGHESWFCVRLASG